MTDSSHTGVTSAQREFCLLSAQAAAHIGLKRTFFAIGAVSLLTNVLLAAALLTKGETVSTILVPTLSQTDETWHITPEAVSQSYLERLARDVLHLACNVTPDTVDYQRKALLSYVNQAAYGEVDIALTAQAQQIKASRATLMFDIHTVRTDSQTLTSVFTGTRRTFIGGAEQNREPVRLTVAFERQNARLFLSHLCVEKNDRTQAPTDLTQTKTQERP